MNLGYTFYHDIEADENSELDYGRGIVERSCRSRLQAELFSDLGTDELVFKVCYPGLLVGLGYDHPNWREEEQNSQSDQRRASAEDFTMGFTFDHTTGMPYIPGSSVKGKLRSVFPRRAEDEQRRKLVSALLNEVLKEPVDLDFQDIREVETAVFGPWVCEERTEKLKGQDVFLDGYVSKKPVENINRSNCPRPLLAVDFITPHGAWYKDPVPLRMVRIRPETQITLQFLMRDNPRAEELGLDQARRVEFYGEIVKLLGLGAKTNVGYGQLELVEILLQKDENRAISNFCDQ
jgi:CRISPR-associated protein Cmr6